MDIAPELLQAIQEAFEAAYGADEQIGQLIRRIAEGTATYREAEEYAVRCGEFLAEAFRSNLSSDILPDGRMYFNIADRVVRPPMEHNHDLAAEYAAQVQQALNEAAGIRIRPQAVPLDTDRIDGIVNRLASESRFDDVAWILGDPVVNFTQNVVDESIRTNADFHAKSGFSPKIVRTAEGKACKWCRGLAGTYDYDDVKGKGNEVWRRHENCRCLIEWIPSKGHRQTVYNYRENNTPEGRVALERRRSVGLYGNQLSGGQRNVLANQRLSALSSTDNGETRRFELGRIDPSRSQETIDLLNEQIRNETREHAVVIDKKGNVVYFIGDPDGVTVSDVDLAGAYVTHNHPQSNGIISFGEDDYVFLRRNQGIKEMECVNSEYTYRARVIQPIDNIRYNDALIGALDETARHPNDDQQHLIMEWLKKEGYIEYDRHRIGKK